jgi:hypothetical protein
MRPAVVVALCVVVAALTLGTVLLFSGDDGDDKDDTATTDVTPPAETTGTGDGDGTGELLPQTLSIEGVPFTFEYPGTFAPATTLPTGYLAILGIDPINFIDVRLTADEELSDEQITGDIGTALDTETTDVLGTSTRTVGTLAITSFDVSDASGAEPTTSRLNFFRAGGQTWELGCQWNAAGEAAIDDACDRMLDTLAVTG